MLFAERERHALALACSAPWLARSVGFVGVSDGWQAAPRRTDGSPYAYERAENGNVAMTGEIDLAACDGTFVLALGFGATASRGRAARAHQPARTDSTRPHDRIRARRGSVARTARRRACLAGCRRTRRCIDFSAAVLRVHESKRFRGGVIASLSIPWGFDQGRRRPGRLSPGLAARSRRDRGRLSRRRRARATPRVLRFLQVTQEADGHWSQNMWLDGTPYWHGVQMDETALPILLVDLAARNGALTPAERRCALADGAPRGRLSRRATVRSARRTAGKKIRATRRSRSRAEIAALLVAADAADANGEPDVGRYLRETADAWNASHRRLDVRARTPSSREAARRRRLLRARRGSRTRPTPRRRKTGLCRSRTVPASEARCRAALTVSPDALALVRFGLRAAGRPAHPRTRSKSSMRC